MCGSGDLTDQHAAHVVRVQRHSKREGIADIGTEVTHPLGGCEGQPLCNVQRVGVIPVGEADYEVEAAGAHDRVQRVERRGVLRRLPTRDGRRRYLKPARECALREAGSLPRDENQIGAKHDCTLVSQSIDPGGAIQTLAIPSTRQSGSK